ncbi:DUF4422 domain-containing protein [Paraburkholderia sp. DHOC27]|uniref:DUF4422 domain-containing protein n=1 Tax=Paraburkholderia sp. DHOC27 TaxID=2303330 RepID=UPI000E3BE661|nr:DUF4422 domain-containing protein [Paraburkholderia sp. DHOC27]RFU45992.1 DUF4422 domain-containing protein [Paraburkholderia sp. DHOC27]
MKISVYVNYFNSAHLLDTNSLRPIQTGRALAVQKLPMLGDDTGDNISRKNPAYCELTGQYWVWKNDKQSDYIGLMHYRRVFDFYPEMQNRTVDAAGLVVEDRFTPDVLARYGLNDDSIQECVEGFDMVVAEPWTVPAIDGKASIRDHYAQHHNVKDLELAGEIINSLYPDYYKDFKTVIGSSAGLFTNMFIFKRDIFEEYSEWLFKILDALDASIDVTNYNASERRVIGYIAERLLGVFVTNKIRNNPTLKVRYLRRVFVRDTKIYAQCPDLPDTPLEIVSVVAATDHNYVSHMAALVASVFSNADRSKFIDFLILDGGITEDDKRGLRMLERIHPHAQISFVDMSMQFLDIEAHMYFTRATFYRLALPEIVKNRKKLLFLDTDVIVLDDVSKIFDFDLGDHAIAAVKDLIMHAFVSQGVSSLSTVGGTTAMKYLSDYLELADDYDKYFQAGVILFNLDKLRTENLSERMINDLRHKRYWFLDQDVLNKYLARDVLYLDAKWNCVNLPDDVSDALPSGLKVKYDRSIQAPSIIHYAGAQKPWNSFDSFFAHYYWYYLRLTPWYERAMSKLQKPQPASAPIMEQIRRTSPLRWAASRIWGSMPRFVRRAIWPVAVWLDKSL